MLNFFIWINKEEKFNSEKLSKELMNIQGIRELKDVTNSSELMSLEWQFDYEEDSVIATLHKDLKMISMRGLGDASLQLALELQKRDEPPLRVFDEGYSFHFSIKEIESLEELKQKIHEDYFDEAALEMEREQDVRVA